jgi:hypothetical protein
LIELRVGLGHGPIASPGTVADALYKPIDSIRRERSATFGREDEGRVRELPTQFAQCPQLIAAERMH